VFSLCVCMHTACVPSSCRGQRGQQIPWNCSYTQLWAAMCVLGIKPRSSVKPHFFTNQDNEKDKICKDKPIISVLQWLRQEDQEFEVNMDYTARLCLNKNWNKKGQRWLKLGWYQTDSRRTNLQLNVSGYEICPPRWKNIYRISY